ncbi:MAG: ABC transporter permease [Chloroflexi bacterium]|nr:MAG: ABC transporter permease [Chloroflexota bacterium]
MQLSRGLRTALLGWSGCLIALMYLPLLLIVLYAFNPSKSQKWPIAGLTLQWIQAAATNPGARSAVILSVEVGLMATGIALVLGSLLAAAVHRYRFFGRSTVSFLVILPIALPGIVTGIALNATFRTLFGGLSLFTLIVGHATFCVVVVYNNVIARIADPWQTFRYVTLPVIRSALIAGALLAFALSFDEIIVTTFTAGFNETLPIWIFANLSRPNQLPIVNAVALFVIIASAIPVYLAQRVASDAAGYV